MWGAHTACNGFVGRVNVEEGFVDQRAPLIDLVKDLSKNRLLEHGLIGALIWLSRKANCCVTCQVASPKSSSVGYAGIALGTEVSFKLCRVGGCNMEKGILGKRGV